MLGNFATSFYFRIPKNIPLLGFNYFTSTPPHCSYCNHLLKLKEFAPIIGYWLCKGRCNYCGAKIDANYFVIEVFALFLSLFCYFHFYFLDWYLIFILFGISSLIISMLFSKLQKIDMKFMLFILFLGIIYSTLINLTIYNWVFKASISSVIATFLMHARYKYHFSSKYYDICKILFTALIWFDLNSMIPYALFILANYALLRRYNFSFSKHVHNYSYFIMFLFSIINHLVVV
ncbi:prepilin peptidase [Candidatus Bandiella euplotis]